MRLKSNGKDNSEKIQIWGKADKQLINVSLKTWGDYGREIV